MWIPVLFLYRSEPGDNVWPALALKINHKVLKTNFVLVHTLYLLIFILR